MSKKQIDPAADEARKVRRALRRKARRAEATAPTTAKPTPTKPPPHFRRNEIALGLPPEVAEWLTKNAGACWQAVAVWLPSHPSRLELIPISYIMAGHLTAVLDGTMKLVKTDDPRFESRVETESPAQK